MSEKLKALINSIFVQLNRFEKQQSDFAPETFLRECENYFSELDRLDLSVDGGAAIDEHLKLRVNTVSRTASPLSLTVANVLALYFWYVRRPPQQCQNAFIAAKKLRGTADDGQFIEGTLAPLIFGDKIRGFGKHDFALRTMLMHRAAQISANFRETDQVPLSATRIVRTDSWQKKMIHVGGLNNQGRKAEIRSIAPQDELKLMSQRSPFVAWYLRTNGIYQGENAFVAALKRFFGGIGNAIGAVFNYRYVVHVFRDRWPVYIFFVVFTAACLYFTLNLRHYWQGAHQSKVEELSKAGGAR